MKKGILTFAIIIAVKENYGYIILDYAYLAIVPGIAIMLLVLCFMLLGNVLRDVLDVKDNNG